MFVFVLILVLSLAPGSHGSVPYSVECGCASSRCTSSMARLVGARRRFGCLTELHIVRAVWRSSYCCTCIPEGVFRRSWELVTGIYLGYVSCCFFGVFRPVLSIFLVPGLARLFRSQSVSNVTGYMERVAYGTYE